nr:MAG TPA: hypothetical protein [Caudoviricetes sp.]
MPSVVIHEIGKVNAVLNEDDKTKIELIVKDIKGLKHTFNVPFKVKHYNFYFDDPLWVVKKDNSKLLNVVDSISIRIGDGEVYNEVEINTQMQDTTTLTIHHPEEPSAIVKSTINYEIPTIDETFTYLRLLFNQQIVAYFNRKYIQLDYDRDSSSTEA